MDYGIWVVLSRGWHLHKAEKTCFAIDYRISLFEVGVETYTYRIFLFKTVNKTYFAVDYRICVGLGLGWQLKLTQIVFSIAKRSISRVLQWIMVFVRLEVGVEAYTNRIIHSKTSKRRFAIDYRICVVSSRFDTYTNLIFLWKTVKKMCFTIDYRICVVLSRSWHLEKSVFPKQKSQKDVFCYRKPHLCYFKSGLRLKQIGFSFKK